MVERVIIHIIYIILTNNIFSPLAFCLSGPFDLAQDSHNVLRTTCHKHFNDKENDFEHTGMKLGSKLSINVSARLPLRISEIHDNPSTCAVY